MDVPEVEKEDNELTRLSKRVVFSYPLIVRSEMSDDLKEEIVDICVNACERNMKNNENAAKMIKKILDHKYEPQWNVVVGEAFGFEVTHNVDSLLYLYFGGHIAICLWKCL